MPNAATLKIIKDLEDAGFDMNSVKDQANKNPILDRAADSVLGGSLLRRQEFTQFKEQKETEVASLKEQIRNLAANQDNLKNFEEGSELYKAALEVIETQRANLIAAGFEPEEVKQLSFKEETDLKVALNKGAELGNRNTEEERRTKEMPDREDYVNAKDFQTVLANVAGGSLVGGLRAQNQLRKAEKLGIEITDSLAENFERNLLSGLEKGKSYEQIADETFGFAAKIEENRKKEEDTRVESRVREQVAQALKDAGVNTVPTTYRNKGLVNNLRSRELALAGGEDKKLDMEGSSGSKLVNGHKLPANKHGDIEYHRLRGSKPDRMQHASAMLGDMIEKNPDLAEELY